MSSLNAIKGTTISELEIWLHLVGKSLRRQVDLNPKAGLILAKGKPNETRMRYKEALQTLESIEAYFALKGSMSIGICKTCDKFDTSGHTKKYFGTCRGRLVHEFDTCTEHSKSGGGFGL